MRKLIRRVFLLIMAVAIFWCGSVWGDRIKLEENLIRLHVVANSDEPVDQQVKLQVRDAITGYLDEIMENMPDMETAKEFLSGKLQALEQLANETLEKAGVTDKATVSLSREAFPTREYDTFTLPAGVYESLRVTIGEGKGQNWWCVVFPSLCVSATTEGVEDVAAGAGFSDRLAGTLTGKPEYRVRFFLLDCFGWVENWFYRG